MDDMTGARATRARRVVLSYGMGRESTAILLRWLEDPSSRDFALEDLLVVTAQTGDEFPDTAALVEAHVLPRLRAAGVRWVQVARAGRCAADGVAVLEDSRSPSRAFTGGRYRLSDELRAAGTVPTSGGIRKCSLKFKGFPIDRFLAGELGTEPFRHVMGFNRDEVRRIEKDSFYGGRRPGRLGEYPLVGWGWGVKECQDYIRSVTGAEWKKSCCGFCPFAAPRRDRATKAQTWHVQARYESMPEVAADAAWLERLSLAINPVMTLYATKSVAAELARQGNAAALAALEARLEAAPHSVYLVRRAMKRAGVGVRSVRRLSNGGRAEALARLAAEAAARGAEVTREGGVERVYIRRRAADFPHVEEFIVAAPAEVEAKTPKGFEERFAAAAEGRWPAPARRARLAAAGGRP